MMTEPVHASRKAFLPPAFASIRSLADAAFNAVFDSSAEALLVIDSEGAIHRNNARARELLGLKDAFGPRRKNFLGLLPVTVAERLKSLWGHTVPPKLHGLEIMLSSGLRVRLSHRGVLPHSHYILLCVEGAAHVSRAEAKSRRLEAELRSVLESLQVGVIISDHTGRIRFHNARFEHLFDLSAAAIEDAAHLDALQKSIAARFRDSAALADPWKAYQSGLEKSGRDELQLLRPAKRIFERSFRPVLANNDSSIGWCELYADVTEERQIQAKMLRTEKMAALGRLVSGIAHELNNPLTTIMGYGQLLLGRGLASSEMEEVKNVYQEAERACRIVKNLLYFARENKPERHAVNVNEIIERTLALRGYELKVEDISVVCDLAAEMPQTMADPYQLQQVILNLVMNAEQALLEDRGHGTIAISTRHQASRGRHRREKILVEISDDGPGVPPEIASRIFDPFFTTKSVGVGTGLGLSIVYGIVHEHDGDIAFENLPGGGVKFTVELPVVSVSRAVGLQPVAKPTSDESAAVPARRILVVEDEPTVAKLIVDVLREEGHHVDAVLESPEALTRLSREQYDLVISDLRMPRLDGPAFYDALVRSGSPMCERIIFITGDTLAPRTLKFLESKNLPYLAKPFLVEELKLAVHNLLASPGPDENEIHAKVNAGSRTAGS